MNLAPVSRKLIRFWWNGTLYRYLSLVFGLGPAQWIFTNILKVPMTLLRKLNFRIIIYIYDMLIMGKTVKETELAMDTTLYLLHNLGCVINWEKSSLAPTKTIEFLGIKINLSAVSRNTKQSANTPAKISQNSGKVIVNRSSFTPAPILVRHLHCFCHQKHCW